MQKGYLVFELKKDNGATPVCDAQVKIINIDGREVNLLLHVNEDGKTNEVEIYTKDSNLTFDKSNRETPYTKVDAEVRFENDKIISIDGIQVYSNVTSIQEVKLDNRENNFRVSKDKKGKSKKEHIHLKNESPCIFQNDENKSKDILNEDDKGIKPIVKMDKVCIPEFITIHIGELNENGEIITVPFIDYIKNVSCSCVYPTWKEEAIRANVYAIVSFALSRIYTDWYKSKGYGFEITSSKKNDQMYVRGRNLFRNVCDIVDEIFDMCIKIKGFNQPFLSRCYNLTNQDRVLSRWGSLDLAEDGLDALEILKKYYGNNIEIVNVPNIQGIIKKYPQKELSKGSTGEDVKFIQKALNSIGKKYTGITKIPEEDGIFGDYTEKAVRDFQRIFNLDKDGIVGPKTWNKISLMYALTKKVFGNGNSNDVEEINYNSLPLKLGSKGEDVKNLQKSLNYILGHYKFFDKLKEDGYFGEKTKEAVEEFQKIFGLVVDGIVGKNTLERIEYVERNINALQDFINKQLKVNYNANDQKVKSENVQNQSRLILSEKEILVPIKMGDVGENVKQLQVELNNLSKYYGFLGKITEDGMFGPKTQDVVIKFQKKFGLPVDGIFGEESLKKLIVLNKALEELKLDESMCKVEQKSNVTRTEIELNKKDFKSEYSMEYPNFDLEFGCTCGYITLVQKYINAIKKSGENYFSSKIELLEDGKFGQNTLMHIKEFQRKFNCDESNKIDKCTWNKLVMEYEKIYSK